MLKSKIGQALATFIERTWPVRLSAGGQRYDHETPILRQLKWLPVKQHLYYRYPIMASKFMNCLVPEYLSDQFIKRSSVSTN